MVKLFPEKGGWRDAFAADSAPDEAADTGADTASWLLRNGRGEADVSLALETPGAYEVWGLDTAGHRMERVPSSVDGGRLRFNLPLMTGRRG